jgi:peptide chain release factor 2
VVVTLRDIAQELADTGELFDLARTEDDEDTMVSVESDLAGTEKRIGELEFRRMFANPADPNNCFIDIQAGEIGRAHV